LIISYVSFQNEIQKGQCVSIFILYHYTEVTPEEIKYDFNNIHHTMIHIRKRRK